MAVQKNKKSPSRRNMRRAQIRAAVPTVATEKTGGDRHRRHHIAANGYYRGREIIAATAAEQDDNEE